MEFSEDVVCEYCKYCGKNILQFRTYGIFSTGLFCWRALAVQFAC